MADLRAKDADPKLIDRAHIAALLEGKKLGKYIIEAVTAAVENTESLEQRAVLRKDAAKRRKGEKPCK
jgi:uncharacterized protein (DUF1778 family)